MGVSRLKPLQSRLLHTGIHYHYHHHQQLLPKQRTRKVLHQVGLTEAYYISDYSLPVYSVREMAIQIPRANADHEPLHWELPKYPSNEDDNRNAVIG
jgi:hypothetical protein